MLDTGLLLNKGKHLIQAAQHMNMHRSVYLLSNHLITREENFGMRESACQTVNIVLHRLLGKGFRNHGKDVICLANSGGIRQIWYRNILTQIQNFTSSGF